MANISARGAVDLGALATARQNQQKAEQALASAPAGVVVDVTTESFQAEVIDRSMTVPVVIDLWAEWCGPCKQLSPILERLAAEYAGRWVLAKVDIDAEQQIGAAFKVQSIPAVFAVIKGQPVPMFQGALPEAQVRQILDELLKVAAEQGVDGVVSDESTPVESSAAAEADTDDSDEALLDPRFEAAYEAIEAGDWAGAAAADRAVLA
ncbi:MAG: thioredoxin domain-containing protein, partial [Actinomycetota bacterium]|nr:thioredoxin domain-containing protein [Actinomycetota bacterium]